MLVAVTRGAADVHIVLPALTDSSLAALSGIDVQSLSGMPADLFGKGGFAGTSTLSLAGVAQVPENCVAWPGGRITGDPPGRWRVGFEKGRAVGVALDSIEAMEQGDSISVVAELIRIASALPATADPTFSGLPFSVVRAYRMIVGPVSAVIATVVRRINEEANPRQEHLMLVIERPAQSSPYVAAYHVRSAGQEESLQTSEILAAVRFAENGRIAIVTTLDREEGGRLGLLERVGSARWRLVWRSAYAGC